MEQDIAELVNLAGYRKRYNIFIIVIVFIVWFNTSIVNYSLGFLESMPQIIHEVDGVNKTEKLTYDICDEDNYIIKEKNDYSLFTSLNDGTECKQMKVSLIGTFNSVGTTLGNLFFGVISKLMGMRRHLVWYHVFFLIFLIIGIVLKDNYYVFQVVNTLAQYTAKSILNASIVLYVEIVDKKSKAIVSGLINSALGLGGMFYVLMYFCIKKWYYVFIVSIGIAFVCALVIQFFFFDPMKESLMNKNYDKFLETIKYIAKKNGREKEFEEGIKTEKYRIILERLKLYTIDENQDKSQIVELKENLEEQKKNNENVSPLSNGEKIEINKYKGESQVNDDLSKNELKKEQELSAKYLKNMDNNDIEKKEEVTEKKEIDNATNNIKKAKKVKGSCLDLLRYQSVRGKFLLICLFWFCNASLFYGLVIGIKSLKGSIFRNTAILYLVDFFAYNLSGIISNSKIGRTGTLKIFTLGYGVFSMIMFGAFNTKTVVVIFYFFARFSMMSGFCVYYTFAFESYPLSVANIGYAINAGCNSLAGIIIPFIIEYIPERYVFLIYGIFGCMCFGLIFLVPETKDKKIPDNIKEIEENENENEIEHKDADNNENNINKAVN